MQDDPQSVAATLSFGETHTLAFKVVMRDSTNDNHPTMLIKVVPTGTPPDDAMTIGKPLLVIMFGAEDDCALKFYEPDGKLFLDLGMQDQIPDDVDINGHLNQSWTGNTDDLFMPAVQESVGAIVQLIASVEATVEANPDSGVDPQILFDLARRDQMPRLVDASPEKTSLEA